MRYQSLIRTINNKELVSTWKRRYRYFPSMLEALRDSDSPRRFWILGTASYEELPSYEGFPRRGPKSGFRKPYDVDAVAEHAFWVVSLLHSLQIKGMLAQLVRPQVPWFGFKQFERLNIPRHDYLRSILRGVRKKKFSGGLEFNGIPIRFINLFLDFPYSNWCYDIELLCRPRPLVVRFSHHLSVDFATPDYQLFRQVKAFFRDTNLRVIETLSPQKDLKLSRQLDALFRTMSWGEDDPSPGKDGRET